MTEHETGVGFKNRGNRKGKAKDTRATRYPINALLALLDRKLIVESSSIMEQLTIRSSITTFMYGMVVVRSADMPRMSGLCSSSASR